MVEVLGTVAAVEQLAKSAFSIVKEILRAAKDRKDVSEKTGRLITQFQFVYALLRKIEPNFSLSEDPDLNDLQEEVPVDRQRVLLEEIDPTLLKPVLEELKLTLTQTGGEKEKFKQEDLERETKNQAVEFVKNLFHQGATKQKKKVDELITQLDNIVKKLDVALGVGTRDKVIDIHSHVVETHKVVVGLPSTMDSVDQKSTLILQQITDIKTSLPFPMPPAVHIEIALVSKLEEAASIDEDSESRADVKVEYNATRTADGWKNLDPEPAVKDANHAEGSKNLDPEPAAKDANHTLTRASKFGSYRVEHNGSLRFTMSVGEDRFFHFLKYSSAEAEPKMVFPHRNTAKHFIKGNGERQYPNPALSMTCKDQPSWELLTDSPSAADSYEEVFLIFTRKTLVSAEAQVRKHPRAVKISDVEKQLEEHLSKKLEEGTAYDEIVVKHFKFDIRSI